MFRIGKLQRSKIKDEFTTLVLAEDMKGICRSSKECAVKLMHFLLNHQFSFPGPIKQGAELEVKPVAASMLCYR